MRSWAGQSKQLAWRLRLYLKGTTSDLQHFLILQKRVERWCETCRHTSCPALNICLLSHLAQTVPVTAKTGLAILLSGEKSLNSRNSTVGKDRAKKTGMRSNSPAKGSAFAKSSLGRVGSGWGDGTESEQKCHSGGGETSKLLQSHPQHQMAQPSHEPFFLIVLEAGSLRAG